MPNIKDYIKKISNDAVSLDEQQQALAQIEQTIKEVRQKREEEVGKNARMVVDALKQIENRLNNKFQELLNTPAMVGEPGKDGKDGKDGSTGPMGPAGRDGRDGKDGKDGIDGKDGVSVVDAKIDFDGSLVITLSNGDEIDAGLIVPATIAEQYNSFMTRGEIIPTQSGNSGKYLTTDGNVLSWASVSSGSGTVTSITAGTGLSGGTITTSGTIAIADTAVTPGSYTNANITVDQQGRITLASNGSGGGVTLAEVRKVASLRI